MLLLGLFPITNPLILIYICAVAIETVAYESVSLNSSSVPNLIIHHISFREQFLLVWNIGLIRKRKYRFRCRGTKKNNFRNWEQYVDWKFQGSFITPAYVHGMGSKVMQMSSLFGKTILQTTSDILSTKFVPYLTIARPFTTTPFMFGAQIENDMFGGAITYLNYMKWRVRQIKSKFMRNLKQHWELFISGKTFWNMAAHIWTVRALYTHNWNHHKECNCKKHGTLFKISVLSHLHYNLALTVIPGLISNISGLPVRIAIHTNDVALWRVCKFTQA